MTFGGLAERREAWRLSWLGKLLLLLVTIAALVTIARYIHPFLAANRPVYGQILVVEGWVPDTVLEQAIPFFYEHNYQLIITTGGPLAKGSHLSKYSTYAELTAATLIQLGVKQNLVVPAPSPPVRTDRTYASALAVKECLSRSTRPINSVDVLSLGTHARRTQWLFQSALGDNITVGVVAAPHPEYDPDQWWSSSSGVRTVIGETIAYLYARFLFNPHKHGTTKNVPQ
jgi:hypothetical protein